MNYPKQSLGFLLADAGYDVWMGNVRGNTYGMAHANLSNTRNAFWRFTFDEMATYEVPAITEFALSTSDQSKLYYVGHSQGTTTGFIKFSTDPTWAQSKIKQFHALAPVAYMGNATSPLKYVSPFVNYFAYLLNLVKDAEFLSTNPATQLLWGNLCNPITGFVCSDMMSFLSGYDAKNMNSSRNSVYMTHNPAGTSIYNLAHFAQHYQSNNFQVMDWNAVENLINFWPVTPRQYHPDLITVPTVFYWGDNDVLATPKDVARVQAQMRNLLGSYQYTDMDHMDFVWGLNAPAGPYAKLMEIIAADVAASSAAQ